MEAIANVILKPYMHLKWMMNSLPIAKTQIYDDCKITILGFLPPSSPWIYYCFKMY